MNISTEFKLRSIPVSLIVIDDDPAFSPHVGDWKLNPTDWPDPKGTIDKDRIHKVKVKVNRPDEVCRVRVRVRMKRKQIPNYWPHASA